MAYTTKNASETLFRYMQIDENSLDYIPNTSNRGFVYESENDEKCAVFIYPISHKADDSKNFFDTRDSGARERGITWNYAIQNKLKYFCLAVHDQVERFNDYIFSLECQEKLVEKVSGTSNGTRVGTGTQVVIPNDYVPSKSFDRILTKNGFYIAVIHKDSLIDYINKFDNRPYMIDEVLADIEDNEENFDTQPQPEKFVTGLSSPFSRNRILFGAPGTGKSYTLNKDKDNLLVNNPNGYERVTFHPDYSYSNFVGTYKPVPCIDSEGKDAITYKYVPGPFMRTYVKALQNARTNSIKPYLLIVEEINRANIAAVFGDIFQLLDRRDDEVSEYPIQASEDIKKYLAEQLNDEPESFEEIRIPDNMFIWATMNSADQGVFPMDTAFKRRWDFTYLGIDDSESKIVGKKIVLGTGSYEKEIEWNELRKAINSELVSYKINEDKLLGPYFLSKKIIPENGTINHEQFVESFKRKVIMYLFDDAAKQKRSSLFEGCKESTKYSSICGEFDRKGVAIFCKDIREKFSQNGVDPDSSSEAEE